MCIRDRSYTELQRILSTHDTKKFLETIEFFPEEGKYHVDGHRECKFWCEPAETKRLKGICPKCHRPLTIGVLHRVDDLADRSMPAARPTNAIPFRSIVPLADLIGAVRGVGKSSKKVAAIYDRLISDGRNKFSVLLDIVPNELARFADEDIVAAIIAMRESRVNIRPGYDGEYGVIAPEMKKKTQAGLF